MTKTTYNTAELVAVMSARALDDGKIVFGGAGMPLISCILAQKTQTQTACDKPEIELKQLLRDGELDSVTLKGY